MRESTSSHGRRRTLLLVALAVSIVVVALGGAAVVAKRGGRSVAPPTHAPNAASTPASPGPVPSVLPPAGACRKGWIVAPDGGPATDLAHRIDAVSGTSPTDVWAVGVRFEQADSTG